MKNNLLPIILLFAIVVLAMWIFSFSEDSRRKDGKILDLMANVVHIDSSVVKEVEYLQKQQDTLYSYVDSLQGQINDRQDDIDSLKLIISKTTWKK